MGFKVIRDFIKETGEKGAIGIESAKPRHWLQTHIGVDPDSDIYEYNGGTIKIRVKDDDNHVYYHLLVDDTNFSCELALDWASRYAGAVNVDITMDDYKKYVGEPRYEKLITKDRKWYMYMG